MRKVDSVCVYCGSQFGNSNTFALACRKLGHAIVEYKLNLIYGGAKVGLMGVIADAVLEKGGYVLGVVPKSLKDRELQHNTISKLIVVQTMHERKFTMMQHADAFIVLPGGLGTYEELLEIITWAQLGLHNKPIVILNINNYFSPLFKVIDQGVKAGFMLSTDIDLIRVANSVDEVFIALGLKKWGEPSTPFFG